MSRPKLSKRPLPPRKTPPECLCCGESNPWIVNKVEFIAPFRGVNHEFYAEVNQCRHCEAIATTEKQSEAIAAQVHDAHRKWMSEKLKSAQRELGLSLRDLAEKSSIPFATLGRISSGDHLIEATMEKLLWMEIDRLTHERIIARWIQMEQCGLRVPDGSIIMKTDPKKIESYSSILKSPAQSPWDGSRDIEEKEFCSSESYRNLVTA